MADTSNVLRDQIFALLRESTTSVREDLEALSQCMGHIQNRMVVEGIARECGLTLTRFLTNDTLDVYYDIKRGRHDLGYISKGWDDPGFRIGDTVEIDPWEADALKGHAAELAQFCATRGMAMTLATRNPMRTEIQMDGVIYSEGFNRDTFQKTLDSLNTCIEKVRTLLTAGAHGGHPAPGCLSRRLAPASSRSH